MSPHRKRDRRPFSQSRRRRALAVFAAAFAVIGTSYLLDTSPQRVEAFSWLPTLMGPQSVGLGWLVAMVACAAVAAFRPHLPRRAEGIAFALAVAPSVYAAAIFLASWLQGLSPTGYLSATSYALYTAMLVMVSGWPEEDESPNAQRSGDRGD